MTDTRQKILDRALELFNNNGIEYVGMRELASDLGMRVGNITYYFATKDALVYELALQLSTLNSKLFFTANDCSLLQYLETRKKIFSNQNSYRCLQLSFVHLMGRNELIKNHHEKVRKMRTAALKDAVIILDRNKYLRVSEEEVDILTSMLAMVGRLWVSEAAVNHKHLSNNQQIKFYLKVFTNLFKPYATKKGLVDMETFIGSI